jgi:AcrR family transcriptional regulator
MARLPKDRKTHLTPDEIVVEALRQFDVGEGEPSIRSLAAALRVAPSAIYHHFPSRTAIVAAAVERVWFEAMSELLSLVPAPLEADPSEVLVATGVASRRAWLAHYRLSPYLAANPDGNEFTRQALGLMANLFERFGLEGERAAAAFHGYSSFMIGSVLFAAGRRAADDRLARGGEAGAGLQAEPSEPTAARSSERTRRALDEMIGLSVADPERDEELYAEALRRLVESLARDPDG